MKVIEFGIEEMARTGFTHKAIISFALGDFSAVALTQTYNLGPATPVSLRVKDAAFKVVTPVSGGAIATATLQVGYTGTTNGFITATSCFTGVAAGTVTTAGGADFNQANGKGFAAASQLVALLTTTVGNVSVATAGELHVYWNQSNLANF